MKKIEKDELYQHLREFLKTKGIELSEGSYSQGIHKTCSVLADVINLSQQGLERAKAGVDHKLDKVRQVIHEKTAPKKQTAASQKGTPPPPPTPKKATPKRRPKAKKKAAPPAGSESSPGPTAA